MSELTIAIIEGTVRQARESIKVARFIEAVARNHPDFADVEFVFVDPQTLSFPDDGNDEATRDPRYTEIVAKADGFLIVVPEYNHSIPSSLKRMLDSEFSLYTHKAVAFAGVSSGPWGGIRAIEALATTVRKMRLVSTFVDVQFPQVQDLFDDKGQIKDPAYPERVKRTLDELIWLAKTLKHGRENFPNKYHS